MGISVWGVALSISLGTKFPLTTNYLMPSYVMIECRETTIGLSFGAVHWTFIVGSLSLLHYMLWYLKEGSKCLFYDKIDISMETLINCLIRLPSPGGRGVVDTKQAHNLCIYLDIHVSFVQFNQSEIYVVFSLFLWSQVFLFMVHNLWGFSVKFNIR